jgi:hypothetical protein
MDELGLTTDVQTLAAENFALRLQNETLQRQLALADDEVSRLRMVTSSLLTRQAALLEQLRRAQAAGRQVSPDVLAASLAAALERATGAMEDRTIARARAQVRAMLQIEGGDPGLVVGDPRSAESASLSTLTFDLSPLPPTRGQQAMQTALARVQNRLLHLQTALDRDIPSDAQRVVAAAQTQLSLLLSAPLDLPSLASRLADLTSALLQLAELLPDIGGLAKELEGLRASLPAEPSPADVTALADAIEAVAVAVAAAQSPTR